MLDRARCNHPDGTKDCKSDQRGRFASIPPGGAVRDRQETPPGSRQKPVGANDDEGFASSRALDCLCCRRQTSQRAQSEWWRVPLGCWSQLLPTPALPWCEPAGKS